MPTLTDFPEDLVIHVPIVNGRNSIAKARKWTMRNYVKTAPVKEEKVHTVNAVTVEPSITASDLSRMQCEDESMNWIMEVKAKGGHRPDWSKVETQSYAKKSLWRIWDQLEMRQNVLCRRWESDNGEEVKSKIVLPKKCRKKVVQELHGSATGGHLGMNKTIAKTRMRYYWPCMDSDIRSIVRMCDVCASKKSPTKT